MKKTMFLTGLSVLALTACKNQEQMDAKMVKGCEAALKAQYGDDKVQDVKTIGAGGETRMDGTFRRIDITFVDGSTFDQSIQPVKCYFSEQWGMGNSGHTAVLEQIVINRTIYGKEGGVVQGALEDFLKLTEAADQAMKP